MPQIESCLVKFDLEDCLCLLYIRETDGSVKQRGHSRYRYTYLFNGLKCYYVRDKGHKAKYAQLSDTFL